MIATYFHDSTERVKQQRANACCPQDVTAALDNVQETKAHPPRRSSMLEGRKLTKKPSKVNPISTARPCEIFALQLKYFSYHFSSLHKGFSCNVNGFKTAANARLFFPGLGKYFFLSQFFLQKVNLFNNFFRWFTF